MRERASVVARGSGHEQGGPAVVPVEPAHDVERAADLVGERGLDAFELDSDAAPCNPGEPRGLTKRRPQDVPLDADGRRADILEADQAGPDPPASSISASCPANADRAIT